MHGVIRCLQIITAEETEIEFIYIVCRLAFVDCYILINRDVTATDHSLAPAHPMLLAQWFVPLVAGPVQPCGELISHPPFLYLTHTLLEKPYSDWPIALFGSLSTAGGFTYATQVNQNDPKSTYWSVPDRQKPTEPDRLRDIQHPTCTNTSSCVEKFSTNFHSFKLRYAIFIKIS